MGSCCNGVYRLLLIVINIVFLLAGLALAALGFVLRYGKTLYEHFLDDGIAQLKNVLQDTKLESFDVDSINLGEVMKSISIGLIVGGLALFTLAMLGCCGACYTIKCMLKLYAIVVIIFVIVEAIGLGLLYGKPDLVKDQIKDSMKDYKGIESSEVMSLAWNIIMIQFQCCGVDNATDFKLYAKSWKNNITIVKVNYLLETPIACCKTLPTAEDLSSFQCAMQKGFNISMSNAEKGCYAAIWDLSFGNNAISIPVLVICGIIQLLFIFFAITIADNVKVSPMR